MAYNKAKEEKKWRLWKEAEEKQLRKLGVDESTIETLRTHDWAIFNSDRRYYQRMQEAGTYLEGVADDLEQIEGLPANSIILFEQLRTIDKSRLKEHLTHLDEQYLKSLEFPLLISIGVEKRRSL